MFYSETLLAKTGPLARVWLAANLERKLTKQNVLSSNLETNVKDIIGQGQAPMALRLSGQLLLGVVKIYSKKAKYLLDDCSEALTRIRVAFKPGNVDLPSNQSHTANPSTLMLPDAVAEIDLFAPIQGPEHLLIGLGGSSGNGLNDFLLPTDTSQLLPEDRTPRRKDRPTFNLADEDDLGLDMDDLAPGMQHTSFTIDRSIEVGRRAQTPRRDEPTLLEDDDLGLDLGDEDTTGISTRPPPLQHNDDMLMPDADDGYQPAQLDDDVAERNAAAFHRVDAAKERFQRDTESPLSVLRASVERDLEQSFQPNPMEDEDPTLVQAAQRAKRRKVMKQDVETQLHNSQIKRQQEDRSAITRPPTFLPRDPVLLQLMEMQRNGNFVSNLMGDGRLAGLAPELRGILSLEFVTKPVQNKRKRDSGIADVETSSERSVAVTPELEIPTEQDITLAHQDSDRAYFSDEDNAAAAPQLNDEGDFIIHEEDQEPPIGFDITEAPLLHPSQSGPVSVGTKNAVHALRSFFAPSHSASAATPPSPSARVNASAAFTDLCPEKTTSRSDATKMFFELLVLGTKDAIKVEQDSKELGMPIRVRGKRGLWGEWAERGVIIEEKASERRGLTVDGED